MLDTTDSFPKPINNACPLPVPLDFGPESIEGLTAEGLVAGRQSRRKDFITILP
jgi:hypothetical protein